MINRLSVIILICSISFISSYSLADTKDDTFKGHVPHIKITKIIQTVEEYVKEKEIKIKNYFIQNVRYDSSQEKWLLLFNGNIPMPGNHFMISIDDKTGEKRLIPGR